MRRASLLVLTLFGASLSASLCTGAEVYPSKPVRVIVAAAAGNTTDFTGRLISQHLSEQLGTSFIVDNRGGAGGIVGFGILAKSPRDGYTLGIVEAGFTIQPGMTKSLPYDPIKDFTPISEIVRFPTGLVVIPSLNVNTLKEFIAQAQANPGKFNYGSSGYGGAVHLWAELFKQAAKVDIAHVPYKGGGDIVNAMLGGQVQMLITTIPTFFAQVKSGRLRALAVATDGKRLPSLPDVPSFSEAGIPGMVIYGWQGLQGPAGIPKEVVNKLHAEVVKALALPAVRESFAAQSGEVVGGSPEEASKYVRDEIRRWTGVIKSAGITSEK